MIEDWQLSDLVLATYRDLYESLIPPGFVLVDWIDVGPPSDTQVAIFRKDHALIIAFPGSVGFWDWLRNIAAGLQLHSRPGRIVGPRGERSRFPNSQTVDAWRQAWCTVSPQVDDIVTKERPDELYIAGHSLGGALAINCAASFYARGDVVELVTFAAPRAGTPATENALRGCPCRRYEIRADLVPRLPAFSQRWRAIGSRIPLPGAVGGIGANHSMTLYRQRVRELYSGR